MVKSLPPPKIRIKSNLSEFHVILFDVETKDLEKKGFTNIFAVNITRNQTLKTTDFVKPRRRISPNASQLRGITNDIVKNGDPERNALEILSNFIPKKSILVGHNVNFDKKALLKAHQFWAQKHDSHVPQSYSSSTDQPKNSIFNCRNLILFETLPIMKESLN
jgi:DNA polymerase III alpha subunit (gram-positive type)